MLCCKAMRSIAPLVPDDSSPLCIYFTVLYLLVCLGVLWFTWTFPRELSAFWRQTVCSPLWCLCRELIPQEQLWWEQILINGRMPLVFYLMCHISVNLSIWFSPFFCLSGCCNTVVSSCRLTLWRSSAQGQTCTNLWRAINLAVNKIEHCSQSKIKLAAKRKPR